MKTQRKIIISEVTRSNKRLKTSAKGEYMPIDLLIEIFSRLPSKSVARCRCVSKTWDSILRLPSFTELFLTRSLARPRLLFACYNEVNNEVLVFSCAQPRIVDENLSILTASHHMKIPCNSRDVRWTPTRGLIYLRDNMSVICNPSTGQSWTLPKEKTRRTIGVRSYFGYDPVEKQYKVLSMTWKYSCQDFACEEHQVMTLGTREPSWRRIQCPIPHFPFMNNQICINGVLYYTAFQRAKSSALQRAKSSARNLIIVCFDVKSEKFSFVEYMETTPIEYGVTPLINCNWKLGSLSSNHKDFVSGGNSSITLWVLEDADEKQKWLKHTYILPALWKNIVGNLYLSFVGVTQTKEVVLSTCSQCVPFYIFFYNTEKERITRVEIQGMETVKTQKICTYLDHIEDVKLMQM